MNPLDFLKDNYDIDENYSLYPTELDLKTLWIIKDKVYVACAMIKITDDTAYVTNMCVDKQYRNKGIVNELKEKIKEYCIKNNVRKLYSLQTKKYAASIKVKNNTKYLTKGKKVLNVSIINDVGFRKVKINNTVYCYTDNILYCRKNNKKTKVARLIKIDGVFEPCFYDFLFEIGYKILNWYSFGSLLQLENENVTTSYLNFYTDEKPDIKDILIY